MVLGRHNETLKAIRRYRRRQGDHLLLEGPHLVGEALQAGLELDPVLATEAFLDSAEGRRLAPRLRRAPLVVTAEAIESVADADTPRGLLAVSALPRRGPEALSPARDAVCLYLEAIQDPGNLGALARVAEAFGAAALALSAGCAHPNHPRALRASAGSLLRLPVAVDATIEALDRRFAAPPLWVALAAHGGADPRRSGAPRPLVLALGAEGAGLSAALAERADRTWTIPLAGRVESLNVAVAAAIALFAHARP
jgi:TrmH family RNA methyltransferase